MVEAPPVEVPASPPTQSGRRRRRAGEGAEGVADKWPVRDREFAPRRNVVDNFSEPSPADMRRSLRSRSRAKKITSQKFSTKYAKGHTIAINELRTKNVRSRPHGAGKFSRRH